MHAGLPRMHAGLHRNANEKLTANDFFPNVLSQEDSGKGVEPRKALLPLH